MSELFSLIGDYESDVDEEEEPQTLQATNDEPKSTNSEPHPVEQNLFEQNSVETNLPEVIVPPIEVKSIEQIPQESKPQIATTTQQSTNIISNEPINPLDYSLKYINLMKTSSYYSTSTSGIFQSIINSQDFSNPSKLRLFIASHELQEYDTLHHLSIPNNELVTRQAFLDYFNDTSRGNEVSKPPVSKPVLIDPTPLRENQITLQINRENLPITSGQDTMMISNIQRGKKRSRWDQKDQ